MSVVFEASLETLVTELDTLKKTIKAKKKALSGSQQDLFSSLSNPKASNQNEVGVYLDNQKVNALTQSLDTMISQIETLLDEDAAENPQTDLEEATKARVGAV